MTPVDPDRSRIPGCGLAAYMSILLGIMALGLVGSTLAFWSLVSASADLTPMRLSYGGVVDAAVLAPIRATGLVGPTEVPDVFHAERQDGTAACVIAHGTLIHLGADGTHQSIPLAGIRAVTASESEVRATGDTEVVCVFNPGEGAEKLARMLQAPIP